MKKVKKILTIVSLVCLVVSVGLLIGAIFGLKVFRKPLLSVLLSFATLSVASAFSINSLTMKNKNSTISYITLALMSVSTVMALIIFFSNFTTPVYFNKAIIVLGMFTVLSNIVVSLILKLDKRYLALQIVTYLIIFVIDIILTLQVFGVDMFGIKGFWKIFLVLCLVAFALLCTTGIVGRKANSDENYAQTKSKRAPITNEQYLELIAKVEQLEKENASLKQQLGIK